jgi:SCY1-like protein 1
MALMATSESFDGEDSAKLIIPAVSPCLIDVEKIVRDQAKGAMAIFLAKAEDLASKMPDAASSDDSSQSFQDPNGAQRLIASTASGAASALTSWTLSQFAKPADSSQLPFNSLMSSGASTRVSDSGSSVPASTPMVTSPSSDSLSTPDVAPPSWSKQGNLMDVMDDDDDWTGFKTAPAKSILSAKKKKTLGSNISNTLNGLNVRSGSSNSSTSIHTKKSLAVLDVADGGAWDDDDLMKNLSVTPVKSNTTVVDHLREQGVTISRVDSPASAFAKTPEWEKGGENRGVGDVGNWGAVEAAPFVVDTSATAAATTLMSKEEKRAEMEKKRDERKKRMAQLKESKASKLANGLA